MTLIIHPGPPGDADPSALDYVLMGDDGSIDDADELLRQLDSKECTPGRRYWGGKSLPRKTLLASAAC